MILFLNYWQRKVSAANFLISLILNIFFISLNSIKLIQWLKLRPEGHKESRGFTTSLKTAQCLQQSDVVAGPSEALKHS